MISVLLAASASALFAQTPLQPWSALVGHCWAGPAPGGQGTDKHCFESVYDGQHVRDRHSVTIDGKQVYAGETIYSAKGPKVVLTYWNSLGGLGTAEAVIAGNEWKFSGTIHATATSPEQPMTAFWKIVPGGYDVIDGPNAPVRSFRTAD